MTVFLSSTYFTDQQLQFHSELYEIPPGETIPLHSHEFFELVYVLDGEGEHDYGGSSFRVSTGDVFVIEPGMEHGYRTNANNSLKVYNILFELTFLKQELEMMSALTPFVGFFYVEPFFRESVRFQSRLTLKPVDQIEISFQLERLVKEYDRKATGYQVLTRTKLIEVLITLSRCYEQQQRKPLASFADEQAVFERVCEFINTHYAQPISLQQVCKLCGMGQTAFSVKFKEHTGKTFVEYRNDVRIDIARRMLRNSDAKMLEIALDVGFEDVSHFNKLFKQRTGMSPSAYRQQ